MAERIIDFMDFSKSLRDITSQKPGTQIVGFRDYAELTQLEMKASGEICRRYGTLTGGGGSIYRFIRQEFKTKHFNGSVKDINVTIIPPDRSAIPSDKQYVIDDSIFSFLSALTLSSTGRGVIGTYIVESTQYFHRTTKNPGVWSAIREVKGTTGADVLTNLLTASQIDYTVAQWQGLLTVLNAGLPTLGKRR